MTGLLLLLTLAASDASSSFSSVVQESIAAAAVEVEAMLIVQDEVDVMTSKFRKTKMFLSAASVLFWFLFSVYRSCKLS